MEKYDGDQMLTSSETEPLFFVPGKTWIIFDLLVLFFGIVFLYVGLILLNHSWFIASSCLFGGCVIFLAVIRNWVNNKYAYVKFDGTTLD